MEMREPGENPGHCQNAVCVRGCFFRSVSWSLGKPEKAGEQARDHEISHCTSQKTYDVENKKKMENQGMVLSFCVHEVMAVTDIDLLRLFLCHICSF